MVEEEDEKEEQIVLMYRAWTEDRVTYICMLLMLHSLDACIHTDTHPMLFIFMLICLL